MYDPCAAVCAGILPCRPPAASARRLQMGSAVQRISVALHSPKTASLLRQTQGQGTGRGRTCMKRLSAAHTRWMSSQNSQLTVVPASQCEDVPLLLVLFWFIANIHCPLNHDYKQTDNYIISGFINRPHGSITLTHREAGCSFEFTGMEAHFSFIEALHLRGEELTFQFFGWDENEIKKKDMKEKSSFISS